MRKKNIEKGYKGYVSSRPILDNRVPQHIQNLVIRDYAKKNGIFYKLSAVEYAIEDSFLILKHLVDQIQMYDGIILYTMFMLPGHKNERQQIYKTVLKSNGSLHSAVEGFSLTKEEDIAKWENVILTEQICRDINYSEIEDGIRRFCRKAT